MRLDLYLKTTRLIKRRSLARELCDSGRVLVNGRQAKPAREVKQGDIVTLAFSSRVVDLEIIGIPTARLSGKASAHELYRVTSEKRTLPDKDLWSENLASS